MQSRPPVASSSLTPDAVPAGWPRVSVVIPTLNEARNLPHVFAALPGGLHEVILVDGHSTDGTVQVAESLWPGLIVVKQTRTGKGNAMACGFAEARGDIIVCLDADGSTDPREIPRFVQALLDGADYAKGTRFAPGGGSVDITRFRRMGNRGLNLLVNHLTGTHHSDLCYGYTAIWARHLPVFRLDPSAPASPRGPLWGDGFEIETLMSMRAALAGLRIAEVPSFERHRVHGASNLHALPDGLRVLGIIVRTLHEEKQRRRRARLRAPRLAVCAGPAPDARHDDAEFHPVRLLDLEAAEPLPALSGTGDEGRARILVRVHTRPVAEVDVTVPAGGLPAPDLDRLVRDAAGAAITAHLDADGGDLPDCLRRRNRVLQEAPPMTVVIATRDRTESLARTLEHVAHLRYPRYEVLVVDSAPADHSTAGLVAERSESLPGLRYLRLDKPGLGLAHNVALDHVTTPWVAFTDDDVLVDQHWLTGIAEAIDAQPDAACVTGPVLPAEIASPAQDLVERNAAWPQGFRRQVFSARTGGGPLFPFTAGRFGTGANMAFRVDVLRGLGGFDPVLGAGTPARGGDDIAAFLRIVRSGHTLVFEPAALVRHFHRRGYKELRLQMRGYGTGLTAYLLSSLEHDPRAVPELTRRAVPAVRHLLSTESDKNVGRGEEFPRELVRAEWRGILGGPLAYARSRRIYRTERRRAQPDLARR